MKHPFTWILAGVIAVSIIVIARQNSKPKEVDQFRSGRIEDMGLGDTADNRGFDRISNI